MSLSALPSEHFAPFLHLRIENSTVLLKAQSDAPVGTVRVSFEVQGPDESLYSPPSFMTVRLLARSMLHF